MPSFTSFYINKYALKRFESPFKIFEDLEVATGLRYRFVFGSKRQKENVKT